MLGLSHRTWPSFFLGGGGRGVCMSQVWISKLIKLMLFWRGSYVAVDILLLLFTEVAVSTHLSLVNINVMLSDCLKSMLLVWTFYQGLLSRTCTLKNKTLQPNAEILWEGWRHRVLITLSFLEPPSSQKPIFIGLWKHNCLFLGIGKLGRSWIHLLFY